jgi:hypothetical protein
MKLFPLFPLIVLSACGSGTYISYQKYEKGFSLSPGDLAAPVIHGESYPDCADRSDAQMPDLWQIDSISENAVRLKKTATYRLDSLDYYERQQMKKFDKPAYKARKRLLTAVNYTGDMPYFVYLLPDSTIHKSIVLDSVSAWILPRRYTECVGPLKRNWIDYWGMKEPDQPFLFPIEGLHRTVRIAKTKD